MVIVESVMVMLPVEEHERKPKPPLPVVAEEVAIVTVVKLRVQVVLPE